MKRSIAEQIKALPPEQKALVPEIKVEIEPKFELTTPAPDMSVVADAVKQMMSVPGPEPKVELHVHEDRKPKTIQVDITERDGRGFIKSFVCTEISNGR